MSLVRPEFKISYDSEGYVALGQPSFPTTHPPGPQQLSETLGSSKKNAIPHLGEKHLAVRCAHL